MEYSLYEKNHPARREQASSIAMGKILEVDAKNRICTVATVTGYGSTFDQYITNCQWLTPDSHPEGDESGSIPRRGAWGLVFFIEGQAFIWGYLRPFDKTGSAARGNEASTLNEGDKIISTLYGNRLTIKRSGLIEFYISDALRRIMLPTKGQIIDQCRNYQLTTDGGVLQWFTNRLLQSSYTAEYATSIARTFILQDKIGFANVSTVFKRVAGPSIPGITGTSLPVYTESISLIGERTITCTPPIVEGSPVGFKSITGPDGSISVKAGSAQTVTFDVTPIGDTTLDVNKLVNVNISPTGDVTVKGPVATFTMDKLGASELKNANASAKMTPLGDVVIKNNTASAEMTAMGDINVKNPIVKMSLFQTGAISLENAGCTISISPAGEVTISTKTKTTIDSKLGVDIKSMGPVNIEGMGPMNIKTKGIIQIDGGSGASDFVLTNPTTLSPFTGAPLVPFSTTVMVSK